MGCYLQWPFPMDFPARLIQLRHAQALTQQALADAVEIHVNQIRRYEAAQAQPTLEALIKLARALHVSIDSLVFGEDARGPEEEFRLRFEALQDFTPEEKRVAGELLDSLILKHTANRLSGTARGQRA